MTHPAPVQATPPHRPLIDDADFTLYVGSAIEVLRELPDESVHCCVTSPPYWGLRDYGTGSWTGGDPDCDHSPEQRGGRFASPVSTKQASNTGSGTASSRECPCGATRTDQQLGLEPTPEAYVARMVEVFREVRRVLRRDGTCWLNLGDSYNGSGGAGGDYAAGGLRDGQPKYGRKNSDALKPKDLIGIPWAVAKALQQPYYTGRIKDERDRIWLAAMVDAEGCIHIHRRPAGQKTYSTFEKADGTTSEYVRKNDSYGVMVSIDNTDEAIIQRCHEIVGQGARYCDPANSGVQQRRQTLHRLTLTGQQSRELLRELYPHLVAKQQQARIAIACPSSGDEAARAHQAIKDLHNGRPTELDYAAPEGMWERGWFLRSEIIWAKLCRTQCPNP